MLRRSRLRISVFSTEEHIAAAIDAAALSPGPIGEKPAECPLPRSTWHTIVRARRMRVFDWMVDAGFRLLNLLPGASSHFLAIAEQFGLRHKYSVPQLLWRSLRGEVADELAWLNAIAETEIVLVEVREARQVPELPIRPSDIVVLSQGVRLTQLAPESLSLHDTIPQYSLPARTAAEALAQLRQRFPTARLLLEDVLVVPGHGEEPEGQLIQLEPKVATALATTRERALSLAQLRDRVGAENLAGLVELGALSRCDR